jgi:hypothetical protein
MRGGVGRKLTATIVINGRKGTSMAKRPGKKKVEATLYADADWSVKAGKLIRAGPGKVQQGRLFTMVGEKLPFQALKKIEKYVVDAGIRTEGVYVAMDSMGCPRYVGRGSVFFRLGQHKKKYSRELMYFSFYIVENKQHEREIETLLIRTASYLAVFNERKIRASIAPGNVLDYEVGTGFIERQWKKGKKAG